MQKYKKHIIILGSARSGTSWLSETMAQNFRYRMLFEPEQETRTKQGFLLCDQWLKNPKDSKAANLYLHKIFSNQVDCDWIAQNSNRKFKMHLWPFIPKKFIIKFVRCNLSANYLHKYFGIPVIHIHRNPYEVLASQNRVNFNWLDDLTNFARQENLVDFIKERFGLNLCKTQNLSLLQLRTVRWCIENVLPLEVFNYQSPNYAVVSYSDLVNDIQVFFDLCQRFDIEYIDDIETFYKLPSSKAHRDGSIKKRQDKLDLFTSKELRDINMILDIFDSKLYSRIPH